MSDETTASRSAIHQSLTRPLLLAGAERAPAIANWITAAAIFFGGGLHWYTVTISALLVCCPINKFTKPLEFVEDRIGARGAHKGPLVGIVVSYVVVDLVHQFTHAAEGAAPDRLLSDEREPALDLVEPAGVGGSVMDVVARPAREPGFDLGVFVGAVVVGNQVDLELGGDAAVEMIEKGQELLMAMARLALRDDRAVKHVECREQSGVPWRK